MSRRFICRVLIGIVAFGFLYLTSIVSAKGHSEKQVKAVQDKHTVKLLMMKGVVGTAIGRDHEDQPDIKIFVENEGVTGLPNILDDVSVEVMVTGRFYALKSGIKPPTPIDPTDWFKRPVPIGVSTGHPLITAGTIGCRVKDSSGNFYALSNNHVFANENNALIGDKILQPGPIDGGRAPKDSIGTLYKFVPITFFVGNWWESEVNYVDAAIALCKKTKLGNGTPSNGYGIPKSETVKVSSGMPVQKYGRTTGLTTGNVGAYDGYIRVEYGTRSAMFRNQIVISPGSFCDYGDSGSLVVTMSPNASENNKPVGIIFARNNTYAIANPIDAVLDSFGVTIDGE